MKSKAAVVVARPVESDVDVVDVVDETNAARPSEKISEKITINMGFVDLGQIDLLVHLMSVQVVGELISALSFS